MTEILNYRVDISDEGVVDRLSDVIRTHLAGNPEAVRDVAYRTWQEFNRIPWPSAFLRAFDQLPAVIRDAVVERLKGIVSSGSEPESRGAVALLLGVAERLPVVSDFLKASYGQLTDEFTRFLIGGYLRSYGIEPGEHASLAVSEAHARYQADGRVAWRQLLRNWRDQRQNLRQIIATAAADIHLRSELRDGFLLVYDAADDAEKRSLRALVAELLLGQDEVAREFAIDFLLDAELRATVMQEFAPRVARLVWRLRGETANPLRFVASAIVERMAHEVEQLPVFVAARGELRNLTPGDKEKIYQVYREERGRAGSPNVAAAVELEDRPGFAPGDWAFRVWNLVQSVPVPLEKLAERLGIVRGQGSAVRDPGLR